VWETAVFAELRKEQIRHSGGWQIHFWRDRSKEIDFLIHKGGAFELFEAKWSEHPSSETASAFAVFEKTVKANTIRNRSVICRTPNPFPIARNLQAVPLSDIPLL
jgi:predicted AAA+ superfamily ATPase